ncbi:hypothetical protein [uncultured Gammaproteobacteria bacterium]|nr:hypothetical protein [uncultured Gammaproteobacteria bacterium]CAC9569801.1 hypothetical protein [uncultured Gammaproteobacteria bacterium]CAC9589787.1 hypothetical protein [uncultured Gammaproteobacteria bacterium]CAC9597683.1 hypothetical protein [uncultured Gammaproteobacteria bacterium]CAC9606911.1 hypothetical protein [uncultured Gammaproteobacteria bacterium]
MKLNLNNLLDFSSKTNILKIIGDSGDKVEATGFNKLETGDIVNGVALGYHFTPLAKG